MGYLKRSLTPTIDHFDGNTFDYRRSNLRPATNAQNVTNNRKLRPGAAERYLAESMARLRPVGEQLQLVAA